MARTSSGDVIVVKKKNEKKKYGSICAHVNRRRLLRVQEDVSLAAVKEKIIQKNDIKQQ